MNQRARQKIRPSLIDLQDLDDDENQTGNELNWGPAATPFRRVAPPKVASAADIKAAQPSAASTSTKSVRIAPESSNIVHAVEPRASTQHDQGEHLPALPERFNLAFDDDDSQGAAQQRKDASPSGNSAPGPSRFVPLIGGISERASLRASSASGAKSSTASTATRAKGTSRFAAMRKMEDAESSTGAAADSPKGKERITPTGFPAVTHRQGRILTSSDEVGSSGSVLERRATHAEIQAAASRAGKGAQTQDSTEEEEWLDEKGQPMSAFRKSRLVKQGLQPPGKRKVGSASSAAAPAASSSTTARPAQGEADDISGIAAENARKVQGMSREEIEAELEGVRDFFSPEILEALRSRAAKKESDAEKVPASVASVPASRPQAAHPPAISSKDAAQTANDPRMATPAEIRQRFFPSEPTTTDTNLEWMLDPANVASTSSTTVLPSDASSAFRFDFTGLPVGLGEGDVERSRLMGLHNHGAEQDKPGYTVMELLHLSRSTVAAQRVVALQTLGRIVERYSQLIPAEALGEKAGEEHTRRSIAALIDSLHAREQICLVARTFLNDKQLNVRRSALETLRKALWSVANSPARGRSGGEICLGGVYLPLAREEAEGSDEHGKDKESLNELLEALKRDLHHGLIEVGLLPSIVRLVEDDTETADKCASIVVDVLLSIALRDAECAELIAAEKGLLDFVVQRCLRKSWPPASPQDLPIANAFVLVKVLIMSSRHVAQRLVSATTLMEVLQRYVASPAFSLGVEQGLSPAAFNATSQTLGIYELLARYGMYSAAISSSWALFEPLLSWSSRLVSNLTSLAAAQGSELRLVEVVLNLLAALTTCATDPHELVEPHGINWSQAVEWEQFALAVIWGLAPSVAKDERFLGPLGAAVRLLGLWCKGVKKVEGLKRFEERKGAIAEATSSLASLRQTLLGHVSKMIKSAEDGKPLSSAALQRVSSTSSHLLSLIELQIQLEDETQPLVIDQETRETAMHLVNSGHVDDFHRPAALATGSAALARPITHWLGAVAQRSSADDNEAFALRLSTLATLRPGEEILALALLRSVIVASADDGKERWDVLRPFFEENLRSPSLADGMLRYPPVRPEAKELKKTSTLVFDAAGARRRHGAAAGEEGQEADDEDLDPLSKAKLWKSPASGLPLRPEWPLLVLDDLLHSAECAALNRPGNLSAAWNANERQIVLCALSLAGDVFERAVEGLGERKGALPSASQVLLGIVKVYMLEEVPVDVEKASGAVTGRDLFRDADIARCISRLFDVASSLASLVSPSTSPSALPSSLEEAHTATAGSSVPFFQLYTDLVALYDAISFSDGLFARCILTPLSMRYEKDYRRLLWNDFAHVLPSLRTALAEAPKETGKGLRDYLEPREEEAEVLDAYLKALGSGRVEEGKQPLLHRIALHHVSSAIWKGLGAAGAGGEEGKRERSKKIASSLARSIFGGSSDKRGKLRRDVVRYDEEDLAEEGGAGRAGPTTVGSRLEMLRRLERGEELVSNARAAYEGGEEV